MFHWRTDANSVEMNPNISLPEYTITNVTHMVCSKNFSSTGQFQSTSPHTRPFEVIGCGVYGKIGMFWLSTRPTKLLQKLLVTSRSSSHSHGSVSVVRTTFKVYGKMQTLTLSQPKIPEPIVTKF